MSQHSHRDADGGEPPAPMPVDIRNAALTLLVALAAIVILQRAEVMIIPIVLGLLISYALDPIVTKITHLRVPRPVAGCS
jgi:predicted PurR-regulated permease PerM